MAGKIVNLDDIVRDIHRLFPLYEQKSDEGIVITPDTNINLREGNYNKSGVTLNAENVYLYQLLKSRKYDSFDQKGYIFVPPGIRIERLAQKDIGYGILGTANLSGKVIQVLETLYGKDFEEVLMHETIHLQNWDKPESWVRYETKQRLGEDARFH